MGTFRQRSGCRLVGGGPERCQSVPANVLVAQGLLWEGAALRSPALPVRGGGSLPQRKPGSLDPQILGCERMLDRVPRGRALLLHTESKECRGLGEPQEYVGQVCATSSTLDRASRFSAHDGQSTPLRVSLSLRASFPGKCVSCCCRSVFRVPEGGG